MTVSLFACINVAETILINDYHVDDDDFNFVIGSGMPKYEITLPDGNDTLIILHDQYVVLTDGKATAHTLDGICEMEFCIYRSLTEEFVELHQEPT